MDATTKWAIGGIITIAAFIITFVVRSQQLVDAAQDMNMAEINTSALEFRKTQRETNQQLYDDSKEIAKVLSQVATTLQEVDDRGSKTLRVHERIRGEEAH